MYGAQGVHYTNQLSPLPDVSPVLVARPWEKASRGGAKREKRRRGETPRGGPSKWARRQVGSVDDDRAAHRSPLTRWPRRPSLHCQGLAIPTATGFVAALPIRRAMRLPKGCKLSKETPFSSLISRRSPGDSRLGEGVETQNEWQDRPRLR